MIGDDQLIREELNYRIHSRPKAGEATWIDPNEDNHKPIPHRIALLRAIAAEKRRKQLEGGK